ncbi:killer cell lectin-like receptor 2 [Arvicola amphibius]|uniref:killer cell lectin-like receptor 2 n=1 Tax=Arvicola amphibius TaxID=1047088 RepID=UPI0018E2B1A5|nr:killer cell lectin-like receptor 2 [Arvicola amphibius]
MSDEEITYATVKFHKSSSGLQNEGRCDESQGPKETGHRECSVPWHLIAIALGIFCSILLVAVTVLVIHIFQCRQEKQEQEKNLNNLYQEYSTLKNDRFLKEQMLRNKSVENDVLKNRLDFINREWNRCYGETKIVLDRSESSGKNVEGNWFCCGIKCYYFIMTSKRWNGCKQTCENCHLSLLKIDDADELTFLKSQLNQNRYWIGLKYDVKKWKWQWIDGGQSKLDLTVMELRSATGDCAFLSLAGIQEYDCDKRLFCICEKQVVKFPDSVCSPDERKQSEPAMRSSQKDALLNGLCISSDL